MCMHPDPLTGTLPTHWENTMANNPSDNQPDQRMAPGDNDTDNQRAHGVEMVVDPRTGQLVKKPIVKPK